jgi:hypothetical protein
MHEESSGSHSRGALNMKRANMQAGRLASTRGNYYTAQQRVALSMTKGPAVPSSSHGLNTQ